MIIFLFGSGVFSSSSPIIRFRRARSVSDVIFFDMLIFYNIFIVFSIDNLFFHKNFIILTQFPSDYCGDVEKL